MVCWLLVCSLSDQRILNAVAQGPWASGYQDQDRDEDEDDDYEDDDGEDDDDGDDDVVYYAPSYLESLTRPYPQSVLERCPGEPAERDI